MHPVTKLTALKTGMTAPPSGVQCAPKILVRSMASAVMAMLIGCLMAVSGSVAAQSIKEARAALAEGSFEEAAQIAETIDTSEGQALAARALGIHAYYILDETDDTRAPLLSQAVELARKAVESDPGNADAHVMLSAALGWHAQVISSLEASNKGYVTMIREAAEAALAIDPDLVAAHLSLGRLHSELISVMGSFLAQMLYGAREEVALEHLERALELAPDTKKVTLQVALGLLTLDEDAHAMRARELLIQSVATPPMDAYETIIHDEAVKHLESLDAHNG